MRAKAQKFAAKFYRHISSPSTGNPKARHWSRCNGVIQTSTPLNNSKRVICSNVFLLLKSQSNTVMYIHSEAQVIFIVVSIAYS